VEKGPKTARSRRRVDLDAETVAGLRRWKVAQLEERLRAGSAWAGGDWVAADELGRPLSPDWLSDRFTALATGAGLPPLHLRQLRHSHATALLAAGVSAKIVQERLGHASIAVTMDTYSSVLPTMQRDAVERLAVLIRG
jgi:integrase